MSRINEDPGEDLRDQNEHPWESGLLPGTRTASASLGLVGSRSDRYRTEFLGLPPRTAEFHLARDRAENSTASFTVSPSENEHTSLEEAKKDLAFASLTEVDLTYSPWVISETSPTPWQSLGEKVLRMRVAIVGTIQGTMAKVAAIPQTVASWGYWELSPALSPNPRRGGGDLFEGGTAPGYRFVDRERDIEIAIQIRGAAGGRGRVSIAAREYSTQSALGAKLDLLREDGSGAGTGESVHDPYRSRYWDVEPGDYRASVHSWGFRWEIPVRIQSDLWQS